MVIEGAHFYDFTELGPADARGKKGAIYLPLAIALGLGSEWAVLVVPKLSELAHSAGDSSRVLVIAYITVIAWTGVVVALLTLPAYLAGATALRLDKEQVSIQYGRGKTRNLRWSSRRTRIELRDFSGYPKLVRQQRSYLLYLPTVPRAWIFHRRSVITRAAFEALLQAARTSSARVLTFRGSGFPNGCRPTVYRVFGGDDDDRPPDIPVRVS
jgi:hypothetical protein